MADALYELIFSGQLVPGAEQPQVQANVAKLFKATPQQIAHLFSGQRVVLKNALPLSTGKKYLAALKKAGALCELIDMESKQPYSSAPLPKPAEGPQPESEATAPPASKDQTPSQPQPESDVEPTIERIGGRTDLDAPHWSVAPSGSIMQENEPTPPLPEPDISALSLAPQKGNIVEPDNTPPPPAPDTSHLTLEDAPKSSSKS